LEYLAIFSTGLWYMYSFVLYISVRQVVHLYFVRAWTGMVRIIVFIIYILTSTCDMALHLECVERYAHNMFLYM